MNKMKNVLVLLFTLMVETLAFSQPTLKTVDEIIGVVGDEIILLSDLENALVESFKGKTAPQEARCQAFENLLYQKLLLHHAKVDSVAVDDSEVQLQVDKRINYFVQMLGSEEAFETYYGKSIPVLKEDFFDTVKDQLLIEKEQQEVTKNSITTPADVLKYFQEQPKDSIPLIPEQIGYSQIVFAPKIREKEITQVIHHLDSVRNDIISGRTSMTLQAAKWSEDPGSKYKGGCYPLQKRGTFVPEYEAAVYNTDEGKFTPVFKSDFGYHFVKVIEKRGDYYESCHILMTPKIKDKDLEAAHQLADSAYQQIKNQVISFKEGALRYSSDEESKNQEGQVMSPVTGGLKHEIGNLDPEINLILSRMKPGEISEPILSTTADGVKRYVIYRLDDRINAHKANLDLDYEIFQNAATSETKRVATDNWVKSKLSRTYIQTDEEYRTCEFEFIWLNNK